jgi:hypothetical protein
MSGPNEKTTELNEMAANIRQARNRVLGRMAELGRRYLGEEVPFKTGNLRQGVTTPDIDYDAGVATLTVSARSARREPQRATLHLKSGKTREITLRGTAAYNYAGVVALGGPTIRPRTAKAILVPVASAPNDEGYITTADGRIYVTRKSARGQKANPYHERAAKRLENDAPKTGNGVLIEVFG